MNEKTRTKEQLDSELAKLRRRLKEAEAELKNLKKNQERFVGSLMKNSTPIGISTFKEGRYIYVNNAFLAEMGLKRKEVIGHTSIELGYLTAGQRSIIMDELESRGRFDNLEIQTRTKDGLLKYSLINISKISFTGEDYWLTIVTDVTGLKTAEQQIRLAKQNEEKYRTLLDEIEDFYSESDIEGNYTFFNDSFHKAFGYTREEMMGTHFTRYCVSEDQAKDVRRKYIKMYFSGEPVKRGEWNIITKSGDQRTLEYYASVIRNPEGKVTGFRGIGRDITERKAVEEHYRTISNGLQGGVYIAQGEIICFVNPQVSKISGYSEEELIGRNAVDFLHPEDRQAERNRRIKMLQGMPDFPHRLRIIDKEGNIKWLMVSVSSINYRGRQAVLGNFMDITNQKEMEDKLSASEDRFRNLMEESSIGFCIVDISGTVTYVNKRVEDVSGWTREELIGRNGLKDGLIDKETADKISELFALCMAGDSPVSMEIPMTAKNGSRLWVEIKPTAVRQGGLPAGFQIAMVDVTERRNAEDALRQSEVKLRQIIDLVPHYIFAKNRQGRFILVNKAIADGYGTTVKDLIGRTDSDFNPHGDEVDHFLRDDMRVIESGLPVEIPEEKMTDAKGHIRILQTRKIPFIVPETGEDAVLGVSIDITGYKKAQMALQESEEKYRSVVESSLVGFYIIQDGLFRFANQRLSDLTGYSYEEAIDIMNPFDVVHPEDKMKVKENMMKRLSGQENHTEYDFRAVRKDGRQITVKVFGSTINFNGKKAICGTLIDVTHEKVMEAKLRQAQKMEAIGALAGGIAHDFNNMLGAMMNFAELSKLMTREPKIGFFMEQILQAANRAKDMIKQILTFSRQTEQEKKPIMMIPLVQGGVKAHACIPARNDNDKS